VPDPFGGADDPLVRLAGERRGQQASHVVRVNVFAFLNVLCRDPDRIAIALDLLRSEWTRFAILCRRNSAPRFTSRSVSPVALDTTEAVPSTGSSSKTAATSSEGSSRTARIESEHDEVASSARANALVPASTTRNSGRRTDSLSPMP